MVSIKFLIVLAVLIVAVASDPCHIRKSGRHHRPRHERGRTCKKILVERGFCGGIGFLFKRLKPHCHYKDEVYNTLINLRPPTDIDTSLSFVLKLGVGSCRSIDIWIPGLGDLLSRLIGLFFRRNICVLNLLGDRGFCNDGFYQDCFGLKFKKKKASYDSLLETFNCKDARKEIDGYIKKYSDGKGRGHFKGSKKVVIDFALQMLELTTKETSTITKKDLTSCINYIFTLLLSIYSSYSKGSGTEYYDDAINSVDKYMVDSGCPSLKEKKEDCAVKLKEADEDDEPLWGDLSDGGEDDEDSGDDDSNNNDDNQNNNDNNQNNNDDNKNNNDGNQNNNDGNKNNNDDNKNNNDNDNKNNNDGSNDNVYGDTGSPLTNGLARLCSPILKGKGRVSVNRDTVDKLIKIKLDSYENSSSFLSYLSLIISAIVNTLVKGSGSLLARIFLFVPRVSLCIKGKGYSKYCGENLLTSYKFDSDASDEDSLRKEWQIENAEEQFLEILHKSTKGKGIKDCTKGSQKNVFASIVRIAKLCDNWNADAMNLYLLEIAKLAGLIGNSFDKKDHKLGDVIANGLITSCSPYYKKEDTSSIDDQKNEVAEVTKCAKEDISFNSVVESTTVVSITTTTTTTRTEKQQTSIRSAEESKQS